MTRSILNPEVGMKYFVQECQDITGYIVEVVGYYIAGYSIVKFQNRPMHYNPCIVLSNACLTDEDPSGFERTILPAIENTQTELKTGDRAKVVMPGHSWHDATGVITGMSGTHSAGFKFDHFTFDDCPNGTTILSTKLLIPIIDKEEPVLAANDLIFVIHTNVIGVTSYSYLTELRFLENLKNGDYGNDPVFYETDSFYTNASYTNIARNSIVVIKGQIVKPAVKVIKEYKF